VQLTLKMGTARDGLDVVDDGRRCGFRPASRVPPALQYPGAGAGYAVGDHHALAGDGGRDSKEALMLLSSEMNAALNTQIGHEFAASLRYVAVAAYFAHDNLPVLAQHFYRQSDEERDHAMRLVKYVVDAGGRIAIPALPAADHPIASAEEAVQLSLASELEVTQQINGLMDRAIKENDHLTRNFLGWFVNEQLEEVSGMETLLGMIRRAGETGLLLVENYLANQGRTASVIREAETE
jgi:ferritin